MSDREKDAWPIGANEQIHGIVESLKDRDRTIENLRQQLEEVTRERDEAINYIKELNDKYD